MSKNSEHFTLAANQVKNLKTRPNNSELSDLYGWYKQATVGDINIQEPFFKIGADFEKWKAWNKVKGASLYDSECNYIMLVNSLIKKYGLQS